MISLAQRLLLRKIDRTTITIMMLVPIIALLIGSNLLVTGYVHGTQATLSISPQSNEYMVYNSSNIFPNSMSYNTFLQINTSRVSQAAPYLQVSGALLTGNTNYTVSIAATNLQLFVHTKHPNILGSLPSKENEIAIGSILSKLLGIKTGNQIRVTISSETQNFSITSVINSTSKYDAMLLLPLSTMWTDWPMTDQRVSFIVFQSSAIPTNLSQGLTVTNEASLNQVVSSFTRETTNLIQIWVYLLLGLSAIAAVAASFRTISGTAFEYRILRTIGAGISTARRLLVYEHFIVSGISSIFGVAAGIVMTEVISTFLNSMFSIGIVPEVNLTEIGSLGAASFALIMLTGLISIYRVPRSIQGGF